MKPIIDHIQITVKDLTVAESFYDKFLPILGFDLRHKSKGRVETHEFEVVEYFHPLLTLGINSPREIYKNDMIHRRKPGSLHHLAFQANSTEEVDRLYNELKNSGVNTIDEPKFYPQHGEYYYAIYFKDPGGIKYEIVYEERKES
jgi:catechol 2,3-dioxygenase-like lactoylglutathione lyase family enzyme